MIYDFADIKSENPIEYIWKSLRFFQDVDSTSEKINKRLQSSNDERLKKSINKHRKNINKQAQQISYSIKQAEEYFRASSVVGLPTRPLLLYYGAVSLSRSVILFNRTGDFSYDSLRKSEKHNHHGLHISEHLSQKDLSSIHLSEFLNSIVCTMNYKDGQTWGNFPVFFESIDMPVFHIPIELFDGDMLLITGMVMKCSEQISIDWFKDKKMDMLTLVKSLPDLFLILKEIGIIPNLDRGSVTLKKQNYYENHDNYNNIRFIKEKFIYNIDNITIDKQKCYIEHYSKRNKIISLEHQGATNISFTLYYEYHPKDKINMGYGPEIVDDIYDQKYFIINPEEYIPEPVAFLACLYCLGRLARYNPDQWVKIIENNVEIAEFIDSLLNVVYRKFPSLILEQLTGTKYYVHV